VRQYFSVTLLEVKGALDDRGGLFDPRFESADPINFVRTRLNYDVRVEFAHLVAMVVPLPIYGVLSEIRGKTAGKFALTSRPVRDFSANTEPISLIIAADARARKCRPVTDGICSI
jgi:hypothetical protein